MTAKDDPKAREVDDGFGNVWLLCGREDCDLDIVRPGKVQCRGDYDERGCVWEEQ